MISVTDELVDDMTSGEPSQAFCEDFAADAGSPELWKGLSAGEPERFVSEYWPEQVALDPQWSINLEGLPEGVERWSRYPNYVFYRADGDELCIIDIAWATLVYKSE
ncbi:hypothetical protein [Microbacterium kunmingense]|uniref:hypothetical protein n=1 Tax=Microbacterium kunmingense TaxID=2915939 RepID=UPI003D7453D6